MSLLPGSGDGADHYAGDTVGNGAYNREVQGVGRLNASTIYNPTGGTTNGEGLRIEATAGLGDNEWILAGDRSAAGGQTATDPNRRFYVDVTDPNNDMTAQFTFDLSDLDTTGLDPNSLALGYSATGNGALQQLDLDPTIVGDQLMFNLSAELLQDGVYGLFVAPLTPEPGSIALFGIAAVGLGFWYRRRRVR